ncbi:MAG: tRNA (N6-threonylcarbamoyladenosine(37)-N6)-methyltransferase TrmO [Burkholderiales bacterium]|nr:tRNA (N6-threonylcarbamoyladenosine(37)-N6)-methyltransferase TrmO [Burkholderiales bacterium]
MEVRPIGIVRCSVNETSRGNWAEVESRVEIDPVHSGGLRGLAEFSHVIVVFFLDRVPPFDPGTQLLRKPRGRDALPAVGVFAQRTRFRPNPIGITAVKLLGIEGNTLRVRGLDALDGTPVLDIKPYMPPFDGPADAKMPEWVGHFIEGYF